MERSDPKLKILLMAQPKIVPLRQAQYDNVKKILQISHKFHSDAGIRPCNDTITPSVIILESGHQPNFFPYSGVWKKGFLLHRISDQFNSNDLPAIAFFGFADQNLSTARFLHENKIPACNKQGYKLIGFKIPEKEHGKCFNTIDKPLKEVWEKELWDIRDFYREQVKKDPAVLSQINNNLDILIEIMDISYKRAKNFADLNAFVFSKISQELWGLKVHYFRYSDVQQEKIFLEEWRKIFDALPLCVATYNDSIQQKEVNIPTVTSDFFPFWYHCPCGGKVTLIINDGFGYAGTCPICRKVHHLPLDSDADHFFNNHMKNMGITAVIRNVIFSEGLGTKIFISGSGGGIRYGLVANEISKKLAFNVPVTIAWRSRDYYIGLTHSLVLRDTLRLCNLTIRDLIDGSASEKLTTYRSSLQNTIDHLEKSSQNKREIAKYSGLYRGTVAHIDIMKKTVTTIPSILDLLVNFNASFVIQQWKHCVKELKIDDSQEIILFEQNITYCPDDEKKFIPVEIPYIYQSLTSIDK